MSDEEAQEHFDNFFEDVFAECEDKVRIVLQSFNLDSWIKYNIFFQYGEIEEMNVCDNLGDHLVGNVYIKVNKYQHCLHCEGN